MTLLVAQVRWQRGCWWSAAADGSIRWPGSWPSRRRFSRSWLPRVTRAQPAAGRSATPVNTNAIILQDYLTAFYLSDVCIISQAFHKYKHMFGLRVDRISVCMLYEQDMCAGNPIIHLNFNVVFSRLKRCLNLDEVLEMLYIKSNNLNNFE